MSIIDHLLGRKKRNTATFADEIAKQERAIDDGLARIEHAKRERQAAMEAMDDAGHKNADEVISAARRDIERREHAIEALKAAHAEREIAEAREAYQAAVAEASKENDALAARIQAEYMPAANTIAGLMGAIRMASVRRAALVQRARELGEQAPEYRVSADGLPHAVGNIPSLERPGALLFMNQLEALKLMSQPRDVF